MDDIERDLQESDEVVDLDADCDNQIDVVDEDYKENYKCTQTRSNYTNAPLK